MRVGHDQAMIANARYPSALLRPTIYGDVLADGVVIADLKSGGFACVADVLRRKADGGEGKESIAGANLRGAFDHHMRDQFAAFTDLDVGTHRAIWPDFAGGVNLCIGRN